MILKRFYTQHKEFEFIDENSIVDGENVFTILVGKNGTGKSSLLSAIVRELLGDDEKRVFGNLELGFNTRILRGKVDISHFPEMIIALSTSPFDKFPINRRYNEIPNYTYLGLRDLMSINFGLAYMSKIIASLIESVMTRPYQAIELRNVLGYLGYNENIHAHFNLNSSKRALDEIIESEDPYSLIFNSRMTSVRNFNRRFFYNNEGEIDREKVDELINIAKKIINSELGIQCNVIINTNGVEIDNGYDIIREDIIFLLQSGFFRLRNIGLESLKNNKIYSIKDASSGEQSVILNVLGIASKIRDNSLICIDEPEVCLHPEWQEKYIQILIATFSQYKSCHFIIATHSPQIISRLRFNNSYIMQIETGKVKKAEQFINNSIDFQLANIFESPGYKNEYLSRIALNIFTKVNRKKHFDEDDINKLKLLEHLYQYMDNDDPVRNITDAIKEMFKIYG